MNEFCLYLYMSIMKACILFYCLLALACSSGAQQNFEDGTHGLSLTNTRYEAVTDAEVYWNGFLCPYDVKKNAYIMTPVPSVSLYDGRQRFHLSIRHPRYSSFADTVKISELPCLLLPEETPIYISGYKGFDADRSLTLLSQPLDTASVMPMLRATGGWFAGTYAPCADGFYRGGPFYTIVEHYDRNSQAIFRESIPGNPPLFLPLIHNGTHGFIYNGTVSIQWQPGSDTTRVNQVLERFKSRGVVESWHYNPWGMSQSYTTVFLSPGKELKGVELVEALLHEPAIHQVYQEISGVMCPD
jgi:hypothetical protein